MKDSNEQVSGAVEDVFAEFGRTGSALAVMKAFAASGRLFPQRAWAGQLRWGKLTHERVLQVLKCPAYAGAYSYGCNFKDSKRTKQCRTVAASTVDVVVSALLPDTISPDQIQIALAAAEEVTVRHERGHRAAAARPHSLGTRPHPSSGAGTCPPLRRHPHQ